MAMFSKVRGRAAAAALLFAASPAAGAAADDAPALGTLTPGALQVCLYAGFAPISYRDGGSGAWDGSDVAYLQVFADAVGLDFVPVPVDSFDGIWTLPAQGLCDVAASGITDTDARRDDSGGALWTYHYTTTQRSFVTLADNAPILRGVGDLDGRSVIVTGNSSADTDLRAQIACADPTPDVEIADTDDEQAAVGRVLDREAFAYGGGLVSTQCLAKGDDALAVAWVHDEMIADCSTIEEAFSYVVAPGAVVLLAELDAYIAATDYPDTAAFCPD